MNASEFAYWYRHGHGPLYGSDFDPSKKPSPFAVAASGFKQAGRSIGQVVRTVTPSVSWSAEQKEDLRSATRRMAQPFVRAGQGLFRTGHRSPSDAQIAERSISFANPSGVAPYVSDEEAARIRFGPAQISAEQIRGELYGLEVESDLDEVDLELEELEDDDVFGFEPVTATLIGLSAAVPAIALALKGKRKRLAALEKKLEKLQAKAEGASGKKANRIDKKIDRLQARIDKLRAKLGEPVDEIEGPDPDEEMGAVPFLVRHRYGLGPGLGSTYTYVPAALEPEGSPYDVFGSIPVELRGSHQLWPADAATADEGSVIAIPVVPDHRLDPLTEDAVRAGVAEFLGRRSRRGGWSAPRR